MSTTSTNWKYLAPKPKSNYRQLFIKDRRIAARTLYGCYMREEEPRTVEQIAADFNLPIDAVKEAIAYCDSNPPELLEDYAMEEAMMEATGMNDPNYKYHGKPKVLPPEEKAAIRRAVRERFRQQ
jgi:uncharacterized protein (DUF433 family)